MSRVSDLGIYLLESNSDFAFSDWWRVFGLEAQQDESRNRSSPRTIDAINKSSANGVRQC